MIDLSEIIKKANEVWGDAIGGTLEYDIAELAYKAGLEEAKKSIITYICNNHFHKDDLINFIKELK